MKDQKTHSLKKPQNNQKTKTNTPQIPKQKLHQKKHNLLCTNISKVLEFNTELLN